MRKVIEPEMYNYNRFPGPTFQRQGDRVEADDWLFTVIKDYKEAFDSETFSQRFSSFLSRFDYIVGDWSYEQLRLKGFYRDKRADKDKSHSRISRVDEYLQEYCAFGAPYFVLENAHPTYPKFQHKKQRDWEKHHYQGNRRKSSNRYHAEKRHFSIRKKGELD